MDAYDIPDATKLIIPFIDDASNWYVRRSRRRFWKSGDDSDKQAAYRTLHYVLTRLAVVLAPFTPFLAEELYRNLTGGESVHLCDWLPAGHINDAVIDEMAEAREYVTQALAVRAQNGLKVRQPLALLSVPTMGKFVDYASILAEEVNVKQVEQGSILELDIAITPELRAEGLTREVIRHVQAARKSAGLQVDDRIDLVLHTDSKQLASAIHAHRTAICKETLADSLSVADKTFAHSQAVTIEGEPLALSLQRAG